MIESKPVFDWCVEYQIMLLFPSLQKRDADLISASNVSLFFIFFRRNLFKAYQYYHAEH